MKISGVMLGSENPSKLAEFYTKILGKPGWGQEDWYGFNVGGVIMIGPHSLVKGQNPAPERIIIVFQSEDIKSDYEKLLSAGAEKVAEPYQPDSEKQPDAWLATVSDPDKNYIQLATPWEKMM